MKNVGDERTACDVVKNFGAQGFHPSALASGEDDCEIQLAQLPTFLALRYLFYFLFGLLSLVLAPPPGIDPGPWASKAHVLATTQWRNLNSIGQVASFINRRYYALSMTLAPGTGPFALTTFPTTPLEVRATTRSSAWSSFSARNATVGPEPETNPPSAP